MRATWIGALAILSPLAIAGMTVEGDRVAVYYGDGGTWTDPDEGACMSMFVSPSWRDFCYAGTLPVGGVQVRPPRYSEVEHVGSTNAGWDWESAVLDDISGGGMMIAETSWSIGALDVFKRESWSEDGTTIWMNWEVTNSTVATISDLRILWGIDPDQGVGDDGSYETFIDNIDAHDEGLHTYVEAVANDDLTMGIGMCDILRDEVGSNNWGTEADITLSDLDGAFVDRTVYWRHTA